MKILTTLATIVVLTGGLVSAQNTFTITGTAIPPELLKLNYGMLPKDIQAYDLNICNLTETKQPITSSQIFQALSESQNNLHPIGRQIMLAVMLRNQNHSVKTWLNLGLASTTSVLSIIGSRQTGVSGLSTLAIGSLIGQQLLATWSPVLTADQVEKFESQVLEPALVMDGGSCVERTVFTAIPPATKASKHKSSTTNPASIEVHVR